MLTVQVLRKCTVSDKYAIKNNLQNKMQITHFLMASKNVDFHHVCHVIVYR